MPALPPGGVVHGDVFLEECHVAVAIETQVALVLAKGAVEQLCHVVRGNAIRHHRLVWRRTNKSSHTSLYSHLSIRVNLSQTIAVSEYSHLSIRVILG